MKDLKGKKHWNLLIAFAVSHVEISTRITLPRQERRLYPTSSLERIKIC